MSALILVTPLNDVTGAAEPQVLVNAAEILTIAVGTPIQPPSIPNPNPPTPNPNPKLPPIPLPPIVPPIVFNSVIIFTEGGEQVVAESLAAIKAQS